MDEDVNESGGADALPHEVFAAAVAAADAAKAEASEAPKAEPEPSGEPAEATKASEPEPTEKPAEAPEKPAEGQDVDESSPDWQRLRAMERRIADQQRQLAEDRQRLADERRGGESELTQLLTRAKAGDLDAQEELSKRGYFDYTGMTRRRIGANQTQKPAESPEVAALRQRVEQMEREREEQRSVAERHERMSTIEAAARSQGTRFALVMDQFEHNRDVLEQGIELAMSQNPGLTIGQGLANLERYLRGQHERWTTLLAPGTQAGHSVPAQKTQTGTPQEESGSRPTASGITNDMASQRGAPMKGGPRSRADEDREQRALMEEAARHVQW